MYSTIYYSLSVSLFCPVIDCGQPPSPANASPVSTVTATVFGVEVTYVCELGYLPEGEATVSCGQSGSWSGPGPQCNGRCIMLVPADTRVTVHNLHNKHTPVHHQ